MNIAIMGAGLSGLACAITLEQHGVTPAIFEKRSRIGDRFVNGEVLLSLFTRPIRDCIAHLSENFGIYLHPTSNIQQMTLHSKNEQVLIEGQLGFTNIRGRDDDAFEMQLGRQVRSPIEFHSERTYQELMRDYTHVVMATGDGEYARQMRNYREDLTVTLCGAMVEGTFDPYAVTTWLNYDFAPKGYAYLIPISEREANIVIAYPDDPDQAIANEPLWELFYAQAQADTDQPLHITDKFHVTGYSIGICRSARIGNTFFAGNCFGSIMPSFGFGQLVALLTGIYAAQDLLGLGSYEELTAPLRQSYENSLVLRRTMETLTNEDLDRIVPYLGTHWGEKLFQNKRMNPLRTASYLLRPYVKWKQGTTS